MAQTTVAARTAPAHHPRAVSSFPRFCTLLLLTCLAFRLGVGGMEALPQADGAAARIAESCPLPRRADPEGHPPPPPGEHGAAGRASQDSPIPAGAPLPTPPQPAPGTDATSISGRFKAGCRSLKRTLGRLLRWLRARFTTLKTKIRQRWPSKKRPASSDNGQPYQVLHPAESQQHVPQAATEYPQQAADGSQGVYTSDYLSPAGGSPGGSSLAFGPTRPPYPSQEASIEETLKTLHPKIIVYQFAERFNWTPVEGLPGYFKSHGPGIKSGKGGKESLFRAFAQIKYHDQEHHGEVEQEMIRHESDRFSRSLEHSGTDAQEKRRRVEQYVGQLRRGEWPKGVRAGCFAALSHLNIVVLFRTKNDPTQAVHVQLHQHNAWTEQFNGILVEDGGAELLWHRLPHEPLPLTRSLPSPSSPPTPSSSSRGALDPDSPGNHPASTKFKVD
ncbi:hypothetical protein PtB15_13B275 [Puccinia triticina]|nr:hypothetical protein PtB15_13B275 [Puccinia triticina]